MDFKDYIARAPGGDGFSGILGLGAADEAGFGLRTLSGDPVLAAAATEAVRSWRYQPYRSHDHPTQFQTEVTLSFALPN